MFDNKQVNDCHTNTMRAKFLCSVYDSAIVYRYILKMLRVRLSFDISAQRASSK